MHFSCSVAGQRSRHVGALIAVAVAFFFQLSGRSAAQDALGAIAEAVEDARAEAVEVEEEIVVMQPLLPALAAGQARDENAPLEFLKPLVNSEVSFIKRVCKPTDEQMTAIVAAATEAYEATGDLVGNPNQGFQGRVLENNAQIRGPNNEQLKENPYHRIRKDAAKYLQPLVTEKQFARYQTESTQREKFERKAVVGVILGLIDAKIAMTEKQRTEMTNLMMLEDDGYDLQTITTYIYNPQYLPTIPPQIVHKVFTKKQRDSWQTFRTMHISFSTNFSSAQDMGIGEEWIE